MSQHHKYKRFSTFSKRYRPSIAASLPAPCVNNCGRLVMPDQAWDVGHIIPAEDPRSTNERHNFGPAHRKCNRSDGGRRGAAITNAARRPEQKRREW